MYIVYVCASGLGYIYTDIFTLLLHTLVYQQQSQNIAIDVALSCMDSL